MALDIDGITIALAHRFDPDQVTPPAGLDPIRSSSAYGPDGPPVAPFVIVNPPDAGRLTFGGQERAGVHEFSVDFFLDGSPDSARTAKAIARWTSVLLDQLIIAGAQLAGLVALAWTGRYETGTFEYPAGTPYPGIRLFVSITTTDGISPVS